MANLQKFHTVFKGSGVAVKGFCLGRKVMANLKKFHTVFKGSGVAAQGFCLGRKVLANLQKVQTSFKGSLLIWVHSILMEHFYLLKGEDFLY